MPLAEELLFDRDRFSGIARLFPLPNLVLFPHVMQPLHVFEPRYREMLSEALESNGLIAMAVLKPGWETQYEGRPPIHSSACLGKIVNYHLLEDGCHNILLVGLKRIEIVRELPPNKSFREAQVELRDDACDPAPAAEQLAIRRRLIDLFRRLLASFSRAESQLEQLLSQDAPLGLLTDVVAFTVNLPQAAKLELLAETNVDRRAAMLCACLEKAQDEAPTDPSDDSGAYFPSSFSDN